MTLKSGQGLFGLGASVRRAIGGSQRLVLGLGASLSRPVQIDDLAHDYDVGLSAGGISADGFAEGSGVSTAGTCDSEIVVWGMKG